MAITLTTEWQTIALFQGAYTSKLCLNESVRARLVSQSIGNNTSGVQFQWHYRALTAGLYDRNLKPHGVTFGGASWSFNWSMPTINDTEEHVLDTSPVYTITHNADGSFSGAFNWSAVGYDDASHSGTETVILPTIPRASKPSVSNYTVNDTSGSLSFSVESKADFYQTITASLAGTTVYSASVHINSTTATYSIANTKLLAALPSATRGTLTVTVKTYRESSHTTQIGDTQTATATVTVGPAIAPVVSTAALSIASTPLSGVMVAGYSKAKVTWEVSAGASASVSSVAWSVSGYSGTSTSASGSATTSAMPGLSYDYSISATVTVTDSRGRTASKTSSALTVKGYTPPSVSASFFRVATSSSTTEDQSGVYVYATFSGSVTALSSSGNSITSTTGTYGGSLSGSATSGERKSLTSTQTATLTVTVKDKVGGTATRVLSVGTAAIPLDLYDDSAGNVGVGLGGPAVSGRVSAYIPLYVEGGRVSGVYSEVVAVPTSGWTASSSISAYYCTITLSRTYNPASLEIDLSPASGALPTESEVAQYNRIRYATIDGTTLRLYANPAITSRISVRATGVVE